MVTRRRDEVGIGVRRALGRLDAWELAGPLLGLREAFDAFAGELAARTSFPPDGSPLPDRWNLPAAVWGHLRRLQPPLAALPLGGTVERAVRRSVAEAMAGQGAASAQALPASLTGGSGTRPLFDRAIAALLAELALDVLRRSQSGQGHGSPYRYPFDSGGVLVPVEEELAWRRRLATAAERYAAVLAPRIAAAAGHADAQGAAAAVAWAFVDVFGEPPERPPSRRRPRVEVTAAAGSGGTRDHLPGDALDLRLGPAGNVALRLHPPRRCAAVAAGDRLEPPLALPPLAADLLEIGTAVFVADQWVPRRPSLGRRLEMRLAVRRPEVWGEVGPLVEETVSFLARDDVRLRFVPTQGPPEGDDQLPPAAPGAAVALFSGGLDSLAGAVRLLTAEVPPDPLYLVSHYADPRLSGVQKHLLRGLASRWPDRIVHVAAFAGRSRSPARALRSDTRPFNPLVQYLRSFLFLSLAGAVAVSTGSRRVLLFENGPLALNPVFSEARVPTRTAHPRFLALFGELLGRLFGDAAPVLESPFLYSTKGEVAAVLGARELRPLAWDSESCWTARAVARTHRGISHDGTCLPCFIRRAALASAGIAEPEEAAAEDRKQRRNRRRGYLSDVLTGFHSVRPDHRLVLADHLRFCTTVSELHAAGRWDDLLAYCPDLSLDLPGVDGSRLAATLARHADEMLAFVERGRGALQDAFAPAAR